MSQIVKGDVKQLKVSASSNSEGNHELLNFYNDIEMYNQIKKLQIDIE